MTSQARQARRDAATRRSLEIPEVTIKCFAERVVGWYREYGRSFSWRDPDYPLYKVIVTEMLLQRTRAETVEKFTGQFFDSYPGWHSIVVAGIEQLGESLKPIGLWRRRASSLHQLAVVMDGRGGALPHDREGISELPGLGPYMVNAILMYRDGATEPLLDGSMARLLERFYGKRELADIRYDPFLNVLAERVVATARTPAVINWAMLDLATNVCTPREPKCDSCPLSKACPSSRSRPDD